MISLAESLPIIMKETMQISSHTMKNLASRQDFLACMISNPALNADATPAATRRLAVR